jgi:hypothetical protein
MDSWNQAVAISNLDETIREINDGMQLDSYTK